MPLRCICCEGDGEAGVTFKTGLVKPPVKETTICIDCLTLGVRYIVSKAKAQLQAEETDANEDI